MTTCTDCYQERSDYYFTNGSDVCDYCNAMRGEDEE